MTWVTRIAVCLLLCSPWPLLAQGNYYVGVVGAISTLSGDGRTDIAPSSVGISLYKPENGPALNILAGWHLSNYFSLEANYLWNRNNLTLTSDNSSPRGHSAYQQMRKSSQYGGVAELLFYFRSRGSKVRPYLSAGPGFYCTTSAARGPATVVGSPALPPQRFTSTNAVLRVVAGVDITVRRGWAFRYNFGENIGGNPFSPQLSPPGERVLRNFQNLFGLMRTF